MEPTRPGHITRLRLEQVRSFQSAEVPFSPHVTVLLGENGAGKTTVAEMLALLLVAPDARPLPFPLRRGAAQGRAEIFIDGSGTPAGVWDTAATDLPGPVPARAVFAYGRFRQFCPADRRDHRRINNPGEDLGDLAFWSRRAPILTLFRPDPDLLDDLARALVALHYGAETLADPRLGAVWERLNRSLKALDCGFDRIEIEEGEYEYRPLLMRKRVRLALEELSDGYQAVLTILLDLVLRYCFRFITLPDPLLAEATVVVDELDLHLHPRWQRTVLAQLTAVFPNTQFIVTTHSPAVVQGAVDAGHSIVSLTESGGISKVKPLGRNALRDLKGAEIGALLLDRRLFGVGSRYSSEYSAIEDRIDALEQRIESGTATAMSHHKCAYCESPINASRSAHVEHFRPKSLFPSLCYDWENYFLSCDGCNGQKSDKWPTQGGYVRPDQSDPAARFVFARDGGIAAVPGDADAAQTIRDFGLDRAWLCRWRSLAVQSVLEDVENALALAVERPELEASITRLIDKQTARIAGNPGLAYSTALIQCLSAVLKRRRAEASHSADR